MVWQRSFVTYLTVFALPVTGWAWPPQSQKAAYSGKKGSYSPHPDIDYKALKPNLKIILHSSEIG